MEGYFAYWDELLRRHPGMFIDSCASGGRRNDLETLRRAVPLLRSDWYNAPDGQQCHTYGLSLWFPYQGTAGLSLSLHEQQVLDPQLRWSRSSPSARTPRAWTAWTGQLLKATMDEWRQINDCFYGDFYPLTPYSLTADAWMAWQYDRPAIGKGVVQVFRRGESIYESARIPLRGLDPQAGYTITDLDTKESKQMRGRDLLEQGWPVAFKSRPGSAIIVYQRTP